MEKLRNCPMCLYPRVNTAEIFPHAYCMNCLRCMLCRSPRPVQQMMFNLDETEERSLSEANS